MDTFTAFVQKWLTPFTVLTFFGAIVWGVQLNVITLQHSEALSAHRQQITALTEDDASTALTLAQGIMVQQHMVKTLEHIEQQLERHNIEAETWKRKILLNEQRIKGNGSRKYVE